MSVSEQAKNFCLFFIIGFIIGFIFDFFRGIRKSFKFNVLFVNIQDILFLIISGYIFFTSVLFFNNGSLRFYIFSSTVIRNCNLFFDNI